MAYRVLGQRSIQSEWVWIDRWPRTTSTRYCICTTRHISVITTLWSSTSKIACISTPSSEPRSSPMCLAAVVLVEVGYLELDSTEESLVRVVRQVKVGWVVLSNNRNEIQYSRNGLLKFGEKIRNLLFKSMLPTVQWISVSDHCLHLNMSSTSVWKAVHLSCGTCFETIFTLRLMYRLQASTLPTQCLLSQAPSCGSWPPYICYKISVWAYARQVQHLHCKKLITDGEDELWALQRGRRLGAQGDLRDGCQQVLFTSECSCTLACWRRTSRRVWATDCPTPPCFPRTLCSRRWWWAREISIFLSWILRCVGLLESCVSI